MIVWINGTHGAGKTTTARLLQPMLPDAHVLDPEKIGEALMDVRPALPDHGDFQHWAPWRPLVVETARRVLDQVGGTLVMPQTVLVEAYWREIADGFAQHGIPVRHVVLHADQDTLRRRIEDDAVVGYSTFRMSRLAPYAEAADGWLHEAAEVVSTVGRTPEQVARGIADGQPAVVPASPIAAG
ncbi:AAA family ATPase [Curtobacterium sp. MR_MD2014]|uniref:AAA family ATPase n=1 Tax=Curtobacterium sp. MR_MD2014 TaxID=1561023 RepID=UPI00052A6A28|nr:AAA family ATPase [Curtobacterium sp. MR_MD2014]AIV41189.1 ATP-binding protein [Curtobacterium sp. MR_MD2014]